MKREEEIRQRAMGAFLNEDSLRYINAFKDGAEWADSHPHWNKFPDECPTETRRYLICDTQGDIFIDDWDVDYSEWLGNDNGSVTAWTELPQSPKFS